MREVSVQTTIDGHLWCAWSKCYCKTTVECLRLVLVYDTVALARLWSSGLRCFQEFVLCACPPADPLRHMTIIAANHAKRKSPLLLCWTRDEQDNVHHDHDEVHRVRYQFHFWTWLYAAFMVCHRRSLGQVR
jgi:hypothetical protein